MATPAKSVQFRELDEVIQAYQENNSPVFAIFHNESLIRKYTGDDIDEGCQQLAKELVKLENSAAIYTLRIYDSIPDKGAIRSGTPYDGSYNFRFREYDAVSGTKKTDPQLLELLGRMNDRLDDLEEEREEKANGAGVGWIGELLANPEIKNIAMGVLSGVLQSVVGSLKLPTPATVGDVPNGDPLQLALNTLAKNDPNIVEHLQKLAAISEQNKPMFKMLLQTLDGM